MNNLYAEAEKLGGKSYLEGCLACLTAYTIFLCMETHYEKVCTRRVSDVVGQQIVGYSIFPRLDEECFYGSVNVFVFVPV